MLAWLLGGCAGYEQLSGAASILNREVATLQHEVVLRNILRRSESRPTHFTAVPLIRGRNRVRSSVGLSIPFGPGFDFASLNNDQFLGAMRMPVSIDTLSTFMRTERRRELMLMLAVQSIRLRTPAGTHVYDNEPEIPHAFHAFQRRLEDLVDQGLTTEVALWVRSISPPFGADDIPVLGELGVAQREGLATEELPPRPGERTRRYQLRKVQEVRRFCFLSPRGPLMQLAGCGLAQGEWRPRFAEGDPRTFAGNSPVVFDPGAGGALRSSCARRSRSWTSWGVWSASVAPPRTACRPSGRWTVVGRPCSSSALGALAYRRSFRRRSTGGLMRCRPKKREASRARLSPSSSICWVLHSPS